jgi:3-oxoacyl-[acyl-carrier-protein] synthase III
MGFEIIGTGHYVPGTPYSNDALSRVMDTSDEWIFKRSGIRQRHFAPEGVGASDLGTEAAKRAIEMAGISPKQIDYIVFATMTADYIFPGPGALLGAKLGIQGVPALDIRQQCGAMIFGLQIIDGRIKSGAHIPRMDGKELFKFAVTKLPECARALCVESKVTIDQIDWFLAHQANQRINEFVRQKLGVPAEKMPMNIDRFGNTSAGTIPILIDEQTRAGKLKKGELNMMLALGAGLHWGCALVRW